MKSLAGNKTTFVFDALNRETQMIDPLGNSATYAYDKASRLTSTTDRNGRVRNLGYDNDSRKTGETWITSGQPKGNGRHAPGTTSKAGWD